MLGFLCFLFGVVVFNIFSQFDSFDKFLMVQFLLGFWGVLGLFRLGSGYVRSLTVAVSEALRFEFFFPFVIMILLVFFMLILWFNLVRLAPFSFRVSSQVWFCL